MGEIGATWSGRFDPDSSHSTHLGWNEVPGTITQPWMTRGGKVVTHRAGVGDEITKERMRRRRHRVLVRCGMPDEGTDGERIYSEGEPSLAIAARDAPVPSVLPPAPPVVPVPPLRPMASSVRAL
uniref:Uncharacterized protein n=1 Tax=Oryza glumipatula TaxID=40148 RepID=A0A0E0AWD6_9ORYZ